MPKFRKRSLIEAEQVTGNSQEEFESLIAKYELRSVKAHLLHGQGHFILTTSRGEIQVNMLDWIITDNGEQYVYDRATFEMTYEPVSDSVVKSDIDWNNFWSSHDGDSVISEVTRKNIQFEIEQQRRGSDETI